MPATPSPRTVGADRDASRRAVLAAGGGVGLAAFLTACAVGAAASSCGRVGQRQGRPSAPCS